MSEDEKAHYTLEDLRVALSSLRIVMSSCLVESVIKRMERQGVEEIPSILLREDEIGAIRFGLYLARSSRT